MLDLDARLARLASLSKNWDSNMSDPPTPKVLETVRAYFEQAQIVPLGDGGVQIEWHRDGLDIEIEIDRHGRFGGFSFNRV